MQIFYAPQLLEHQYYLETVDSKHCVKVLRKQEGSLINLVDGKGGFYKAAIRVADVRRCEFEVLEKLENYQEHAFHLHIAIAPTKNLSRLEWFVEKATEIGIDEISLIITTHSERKKLNLERLERVAISAMKQSIKAYLPRINPLTSLKEFLSRTNSLEEHRFIAYINDSSSSLKASYKGGNALALIGPEGGFAEAEVKQCKDVGFLPVSLGSSRLRTETAGLVACHTFNLFAKGM